MRSAALLLLAALVGLGPSSRALAQGDRWYFDDEEAGDSPKELFSSFHSALSPYGQWVQDPRYGWIWLPGDSDFQPYSRGQWIYTTDGWTFAGAEPYGWVVDHYGRWLYLPRGWAWVPGYVWSPAWVEFRYAPGYVGWCPLGPGDFVYGFSLGFGVTPWLFVSVDLFGSPLYDTVYLPPPRAHEVYTHGRHLPPRVSGGSRAWYEVPGASHGRPAVSRRAEAPPPGIRPPAATGSIPREPPSRGWVNAPSTPHGPSGREGRNGAAAEPGRAPVASPPAATEPTPPREPPDRGWVNAPSAPREPPDRGGSGAAAEPRSAPVVTPPPPSAPPVPAPPPPAAPPPTAAPPPPPAVPVPPPSAAPPSSSGSHGEGHGWIPGGKAPGGRR